VLELLDRQALSRCRDGNAREFQEEYDLLDNCLHRLDRTVSFEGFGGVPRDQVSVVIDRRSEGLDSCDRQESEVEK
jgi:hypothetical protein